MSEGQLEELLLAFSAGELEEEQRVSLNEILRNDPEARAMVARFLATDALLTDVLEAKAAEGGFTSRQHRWSRRVWIPAAAAAVATFAAIALNLFLPREEFVAVLGGEKLLVGRVLEIREGEAKIQFQSDALLAVEAPTKLEILGENAARLFYGVATVRVPGPIKGFELETPARKVIDLGTSFGVTVEETGQTTVTVFEGEVEVADLETPERLLAGRAVRVNRKQGMPNESVSYDSTPFLHTWESSFGIEALEGDVRFARPFERKSPGGVIDSDALLLIPEREGVLVGAKQALNIVKSGTHRIPYYSKSEIDQTGKKWMGEPAPEELLSEPARVDSYLLQYNPGLPSPTSKDKPFVTEIRFDRDVIGIIAQKDLLAASDSLLALEGADFSQQRNRGVALTDEIVLSPDRRTIRVAFDVEDGVDQIRVLVASHLSGASE